MANVPGGSSSFYNQPLTQATGAAAGTNGFYASATQPVASAAPVAGSGVNPSTGAYYSQLQTTPAAGTAPTGGATLAPAPTPASDAPYDPNHPTVGYNDGTGNIVGYNPNAPFYAGNGTFGALGTDAPTGGIGNTSGAGATAAAPPGGTGSSGTTGTTGTTPPSSGVLSGPGYDESWFQQNGNDLNGPSNTQSLYDEGVSATNPYYLNAMNVTNAGINSAEAARGEGDSGAALAEIGTADANLTGQQALAQENLATSADTTNTSQFNAESNAATSAENQTNNRVNGATSAYTNLSAQQSNLVDNFYSMAQSGELTTDMAGIEAQLAASGVDAATAQAITNDILSAAGTAVKATSGGATKPAGS